MNLSMMSRSINGSDFYDVKLLLACDVTETFAFDQIFALILVK